MAFSHGHTHLTPLPADIVHMPVCPTKLQGDVQSKRVRSDAIISRNQFSDIPKVAYHAK